MSHWFAMGGYGWFVWPSYGFFALVVGVNWYTARRAHRAALSRARRRIERSQKS